MLTQLTTVKTRLGIAAEDTADDTLLTNFIKGISSRFDDECDRQFAREEGIWQEFQADETEVRVKRYPIEVIIGFDLKVNERLGWKPQSGVEHIIRNECVISLDSPIGTWKQQARVMYVGGYVLPGATADTDQGQTALPDEIEQACIEQVAYLYQNRHRLGLVSVSGEGASIQQYAVLDLLPNVKAVLKNNSRWTP